MVDLNSIFRYKRLNVQKALAFGFKPVVPDASAPAPSESFSVTMPIMKEQFDLCVTVSMPANVSFKVTDRALNEEYALVHVSNAQGKFVCDMRTECEKELNEIAQKCFDTELLRTEQTKRTVESIAASYGVTPEFPWDDSPDCAVFRHHDNRKWFAIIMTVSRGKLGITSDKDSEAEIINLKAPPEVTAKLVLQDGFYPAYHMNKTHWFTVCLDGTVSDAELFSHIAASYELTKSKKTSEADTSN